LLAVRTRGQLTADVIRDSVRARFATALIAQRYEQAISDCAVRDPIPRADRRR